MALHCDSFHLQDEISTGLDSSTTYLITKCIRNFVHMQDVRALIQAIRCSECHICFCPI